MSRETPARKNGQTAKQRPKRRKQSAPELPEKTKKLIPKAFRLAYEQHHGKSS